MRKQILRFFVTYIFLSISSISFSQVVIVATPSTGCAPAVNVSFSGPAGSGYYWDFGDGSPPVTGNQNPTHIYSALGSHVVTYTSSVGSGTTVVIVYPSPTAGFNFNVPVTHCAPMAVSFVNTSSSSTVITGYQWNFGNGGASTATNPTFTYVASGSFTVLLTITDAHQCSSTFTSGPINVSSLPNPVISSNPNPPSGCTAPFTAAFSGSNSTSGSPVGGGLSYNWSFSGGSPSSSGAMTPGNVTYNTTGSYVASLTVTDNNNCSRSVSVPVNVSQPSVSISCPTFVCIYDTLKANDNSIGAFTIWQFGDGFTSTPIFPVPPPTKNVKHLYGSPGLKTLTVTAYGGGTCTATKTLNVMVEQVTTSVVAITSATSCSSPFVCTYTNVSSPNAISWNWSATNCNSVNLTATGPSPTFTFTQGSLFPYTIYGQCVPNVQVIAMSANGCTAVASIATNTLMRPTAFFNKDKKEGCAPLVVTLRDSSFAYPTPTVITSYTWNNGASPPTIVTGTAPPIPNVTFTYNSPGTYTPFLTIQTAQGCTDVSFVDTITVVNPSSLNFSFSPSVVCPNQTVSIAATGTPQPIQHWHVQSDNGFFSGCVSDPNPGWKFTHIGVHSFTLQAWKNSCASSTTIPQTVTVNGPIVQSRYSTDCSNRKTVTFESQLQDVSTATLTFGDGSNAVIAGTPGAVSNNTTTHTYSTTGDYTATLLGTKTGSLCPNYTYTMLVQVRDVQGDIALSPTVCSGLSAVFSAASSTDVLVTCSTGYTWFFDNAPPVVLTVPTVTNSWGASGIHTVVLHVKDLNGCTDTVIRTIRVSSVSPIFSASPSFTICLSTGTIQFNNLTPQSPDAVAPSGGYNWDFGDGSPVSTVTNPSHTYTSAAVPNTIYYVTLTATNNLGCSSSTTVPVQVNNPNVQLVANAAMPCARKQVTLTAPGGYSSYTLSYGDGSVSVGPLSTTTHSYTYGAYNLSLTIMDPGGCKNSSVLSFTVQSFPTPSFAIISPHSNGGNTACLGDNIFFASTSTVMPTYSLGYHWDIGNGANILPDSLIAAAYTTPSVYPVSLTVSTIPNGCARDTTIYVKVEKVFGHLSLDKTAICLGQSINFKIKPDSIGAFSWIWDFGDGVGTQTIYAGSPHTPTVSHTYTNVVGQRTVKLLLLSEGAGCNWFDTVRINVIQLKADFNRNNELSLIDWDHCLGSSDTFSNNSQNAYVNSYAWDFGDGSTSNLVLPSHTYSLPGVYIVNFTVTESLANCISTASKDMTINPLPTVQVVASPTCQNVLFPLIGNASANAASFTWVPSNGVTSPNSLTTTAKASGSTTYTLQVSDVNGCLGSDSQYVYIQLPPKNIQWDTSIVIGQNVPMNASAGQNLTYTWSPTTDLSCITCVNPVSTSTNNITYSVTISDNMGCFTGVNTYSIIIEPKSTLDVPTAFTPNGDGTNDIIYVAGWGIKKLNYFRIYNRWGQLLFESNDIKTGWNGIFEGVPQNMETYVYQVSAETYIDKEPVLKTGSFKLIR